MKQTAVEYLQQHFKTLIQEDNKGLYKLLFEQAKEMEKQQMIKFAEYVATYPDKNRNINDEMLHAKSKYDGAERTIDLLEQYYNETYGSKGSDDHIVDTNEMASSQTEISDAGKDTADYIDRHIIESMKELAREGFKPQASEISDEEIEKASEDAWSDYEYEEGNLYSTTFKGGWKLAIKWYREQLKQK